MNLPKPRQILGSSKEVAHGVLESIVALAYLCAKLTRRASHKLACGTFKHNKLKRISGRKTNDRSNEYGDAGLVEDGLWRRSILMGDKCEPLDFSGVIYYDCNGNMLSEAPAKSPRAPPFMG